MLFMKLIDMISNIAYSETENDQSKRPLVYQKEMKMLTYEYIFHAF